MKKLFILSILLFTVLSFGQIKINPVNVGWPAKVATDLMVRVLSFETDAKTCTLYYEIKKCETEPSCEILSNGNISLDQYEFSAWGFSNKYVEDLVISRLLLTRKEE